MRVVLPALAAFFACIVVLPAATRIDDPATFVTEVYKHFIAAQSSHRDYSAPQDIYSARLGKLLRDDVKKAKGEVGCLDFDFWVDGQDWKITNLAVTSADKGPDRRTVIAKFRNVGDPQEIHFDFIRENGRWVLDDVHSVLKPVVWTLSEVLKCTN